MSQEILSTISICRHMTERTSRRDWPDCEVAIEYYAEVYRRRGNMPLPVVFFDGETYWLADGNLRIYAQEDLGRLQILCEVREGTNAEAAWYACNANRNGGFPIEGSTLMSFN